MTSSSLHGKLDPREAVLERFDLAASSKVAIKQLKNHLIEDLYTPQANVALRLARDSYNRRCPMHLVLDVSKYNSRGQLWLASVEATSSPALLEAHGITHVYSAGFQKAQTKDNRFYFLPTHDGTGVLRGNISFADVLQTAVEIAEHLLKGGYRYVVCCRNGAHRSAMIVALILMVLTGQTAAAVNLYLQRLRSLSDLNSRPPSRDAEQLPTPLHFINEKMAEINKARQVAKLPAICLNSIMTLAEFTSLANNLLVAAPPKTPVLPPPGSLRPPEPAIPPLSKAKGSKGKGDKGKGKGLVETKAMPRRPPQMAQPVDAGTAGDDTAQSAGSAGAQVKAKSQEQAAGSPDAARAEEKKEVKKEEAEIPSWEKGLKPPDFDAPPPPGAAPASASKDKVEPRQSESEKAQVDLKPWPGSSVTLTEGPGVPLTLTEGPGGAGSAGRATGTKEDPDAGEKRKQPPAQPADSAQVQTKPKMEDRFGGNFVSKVREVMETLVAMRGRLCEAAKSAGTAEAATAFEDEVDYGDDEELDVEAASQALSAGDAQSVKLMELLLDEQKRLSGLIEALTASQPASSTSGNEEEQLVERVWAALQANDAEASEGALRQLPPSTIAGMKDAAGATPLHVAARNRWLGLTSYLLEVAPSLAVATTYSRQPPKWTPLMSLANMPKAKDAAVADRETEIVRLLLQHMPVEALNTQSGTGASVTHLAVPKGNHALTEQVLWALYSKGGWSAVEHHLGLANHMGKSALDLALRSNVAFAKVLRDQWWAVSLTPAPSTDERDYSRRYRTTGAGRHWW